MLLTARLPRIAMLSRVIVVALALTNSVCVEGSQLRWPSGAKPKDNEVDPWQLDLPGIDATLQMARLSMIVYDDDCIEALGNAGQAKGKLGKAGRAQGKLKDDDAYLNRLKEEGGANTEMWFYECEAEGTEAAGATPNANANPNPNPNPNPNLTQRPPWWECPTPSSPMITAPSTHGCSL